MRFRKGEEYEFIIEKSGKDKDRRSIYLLYLRLRAHDLSLCMYVFDKLQKGAGEYDNTSHYTSRGLEDK